MLMLSIAKWKYAKNWVYSITYDEALSDLYRFVIPAHTELGIPGHVEVVAGQIGEIRNCGASSFNGYRHMGATELRDLLSMGWGVGCHSWSHEDVAADPDLELGKAREIIEDAIGAPVTLYCSPGDNSNLTPHIREMLARYGYLAGMAITDDINRPDEMDPLFVCRVPLHERYWGPFDCAYDPHKRISQAQRENGWIIDYCHCPLEQAVHDYKDCSAAHHRERLETVAAEGRGECWYANPDDVIDYTYVRRCAALETIGEGEYAVRLVGLPDRVRHRELTFVLSSHVTAEVLAVEVDGVAASASPLTSGRLTFTAPVADGSRIIIARR